MDLDEEDVVSENSEDEEFEDEESEDETIREEWYPVIIGGFQNNPPNWGLLLRQAGFYGFPRVVRYILTYHQTDLNFPVDLNETLFRAVYGVHPETVRLILQYVPDISRIPTNTLAEAVNVDDWESLQILVQAGANLNDEDDNPLVNACENGNLKMAKILIESGADPDNEEFSILGLAIGSGNLALVKFLVQRGIDMPLPYIPNSGLRYPEIFTYFWELGYRPEIGAIETPSRMGLNDEINLLLDYGYPINEPGSFPLLRAVEHRQIETIKLLLDRGADPNLGEPLARLWIGPKPVSEIVNLLLRSRADPNINNGAPLLGAVRNNDFQSVIYLLSFGADLDLGDAILESSQNSDLSMFNFLLSQEISPQTKERVLISAVEKQNLEVIYTLMNAEDPPNPNWALVKASELCWDDLVQFLISRGADVNFENDLALYWAANNNCVDLVHLLLDYGARDIYGNIREQAEADGRYEIAELLRFM